MNRISEMNDYLEHKISEILQQQEDLFCRGFQEQKKMIYQSLKDLEVCITDKEHDAIVVSWLRSSYVTGSHKFRAAIYKIDEIFVEEYPCHIYLDMSFLFTHEEKLIQELLTELKKFFIRITTKEIGELRRYFFDQMYGSCIAFFKDVVKQNPNDESQLAIFYGAELGETERIDMV